MARQLASKARSKAAPGRAQSRSSKAKTKTKAKAKTETRDPTAQRLAVLERERDALRAGLDEANERLLVMEKNQADVRDRIAWALDSLHNILQGKG
jgi:hypothetical protein